MLNAVEGRGDVVLPSLETLREYVSLLERIQQLREMIPDEDHVSSVQGYVENLREIGDIEAPSEDEMRDIEAHVSNLKEWEDLPTPSEDEMRDIEAHVSNLKEAAEL